MKKRQEKLWLTVATVATLVVWPCCGEDPTMLNAAPAVTHVGPAVWESEALELAIWLQDIEEDPVDLLIEISGGEEVSQVGGHGCVGLSASAGYPGQSHVLVFAPGVVKGGDVLLITPEDIEGNEGEPIEFVVPGR